MLRKNLKEPRKEWQIGKKIKSWKKDLLISSKKPDFLPVSALDLDKVVEQMVTF
jgi:hypothetical protein